MGVIHFKTYHNWLSNNDSLQVLHQIHLPETETKKKNIIVFVFIKK